MKAHYCPHASAPCGALFLHAKGAAKPPPHRPLKNPWFWKEPRFLRPSDARNAHEKCCGIRLWGSAPNPGRGMIPLHPALCQQPEGRRNRRPIFTRWGSSPVPPARPHPRRRTPAQSAGQSGLPTRTSPCPRGRSGNRHGCSHQSRPALPPGHPA